jgi:hypothetical protein
MRYGVFTVMLPCSLVGGYERLGENSCLHYQGKNGFVMFLWNFGYHLRFYKLSSFWRKNAFLDLYDSVLIYAYHLNCGIATGYVLDDWGVGFRVPLGSRIFSTSSRSALGSTQPPIQCVPEALSQGVKRPGRETYHSPPDSAEVKKCGSIHPLPQTPSCRSA